MVFERSVSLFNENMNPDLVFERSVSLFNENIMNPDSVFGT